MKSTALVSAAAILAALFSVAANAQTGRPSNVETHDQTAFTESAPVDLSQSELGSYARYLMLNGATRDEAIVEAQAIDHPAPSKHFALRTVRSRNAATSQQ